MLTSLPQWKRKNHREISSKINACYGCWYSVATSLHVKWNAFCGICSLSPKTTSFSQSENFIRVRIMARVSGNTFSVKRVFEQV